MVQPIKLSEIVSSRKRRNSANDKANNGTDSESEIDISSTDDEAEENNKVDDEEEIVNIDFDFYNGNPDVDFHAMKNLSRQLLGPQESNKIQLSNLADLILKSPTTTIKTDGTESDPYCFLSFIDYKENKDSDYAKYLHSKIDSKLTMFFNNIDNSSNKTCSLVMSERLINMPPEVVPPLYKITLEDVTTALGDDKHYDFYVIVSRKYEVNFDMDNDDTETRKDRTISNDRSKKRVKNDEVDYFHEEDRFFEKHAKVHFESESRKGIISSYMVMDHDGLVKSISELEQEIATW
ncbi:protein-transporting protein BCP1 NDAI_0B05560 [Naumovozyma dairenensis CBS 421]|uniref:Protein BCP1 n=1 Tax=Naumovozyma dairenensis (strain ATCC 10597 / BCRC 20456 / CBS 421 / NBRC 0211 / NRRL Y-12639) TaxID=1071378 RepID=G0W728_NAUDC|nr:hypothetical protein NDAI_0B05560 [Naumovozyma dairenensis CBS 421]CCD23589.1 hypothetical protein NDAI_0B05560 [Naumovozyma dairenensis CBS 421]